MPMFARISGAPAPMGPTGPRVCSRPWVPSGRAAVLASALLFVLASAAVPTAAAARQPSTAS